MISFSTSVNSPTLSLSLLPLTILYSAKTLLLTFGPLFLPKILSYYRSLRISSSHTPPPRPLPSSTQISLNILFVVGLAFLITTFLPPSPNIFTLTSSRAAIPTDVLFTRLALSRPSGLLTAFEERLKSNLTTPAARSIYFHYGPEALISCPFCNNDEPKSYLLYTLPRTLLPPHLLHLFGLAIATSASIVGIEASVWRNKFTIFALSLFALDVYITNAFYDPTTPTTISRRIPLTAFQTHYHWHAHLVRYLVLTASSLFSAGLIYLSSTNKLPLSALFFTPVTPSPNIDSHVLSSIKALNDATAKLHATGVSRNAASRNQALRGREEVYWRAVTRSEEETWGREEVVEAVKSALEGTGAEEGLDVATLSREAETWVNAVTNGLEA